MIIGSGADNQLYGLGGDDTLSGGAGDDVLKGGEGSDVLSGGADEDNLFGGSGADTLHGGLDKDSLFGGDGADILNGDAGDDSLYGEAGNDVLDGGAGHDTLYGGAGNDTLKGAAGDDKYLFGKNDGNDLLIDASGKNEIAFDFGEITSDDLWFEKLGNHLIISVVGGDTKITVENFYTGGSILKRIITGTHSVSSDQIDDLVVVMAGLTVGTVSDDISVVKTSVWQDTEFYVDRFVVKGTAGYDILTTTPRRWETIFSMAIMVVILLPVVMEMIS